MPEVARRYEDRYYYSENTYRTCTAIPVKHYKQVTPVLKCRKPLPKKNNAKVQRNKIAARLITFSALLLLGIFVLPVGFRNISGSFFTKSPYPKLKTDYKKMVFPTVAYLNNNLFMNELSLNGAASPKKAAMTELIIGNEMTDLENSIKNIMPMYPSIHPSVFVWDYDTGNFADINGDEMFATASIIKIPVLLQLFRSIEAKQLSLYDRMTLTDYYRAEGSGSLQFKAENSSYTLDKLARLMITESDNSATNMLIARVGSMVDVNQGLRDWGLKKTQVNAWLPDLSGTNQSTARDLARMLYNIENPKFISEESSSKIIDYMSHVKNDRLLPAGLGEGASIIHKTGDIGSMLGDAGIVTAANGKKYIVVILANRPHNSPSGKEFIVKASEIIYNYMLML
ncbi:serine hydrolase [bacterium]|nr:serine hydrolase [bacterium]